MDQLSTAKTYRSQLGDYQVQSNGDYGIAKGIDLSLTNRGTLINTTIQYTFSEAKANGEYDKAAFGNQVVDAPLQEFTMPFDRPHDLTVQLYSSKLPFEINASLVGFYQSGIGKSAAVHYGGFIGINLHKGVINGKARKRGHKMLYCGDYAAVRAYYGRKACIHNIFKMGGYFGFAGQIFS